MDFFSASSSSFSKTLFGVVCTLVSIACLPVESTKFLGNVTVAGFTFQVSLNSSSFLEESNVKRSDFPSDFFFGVSTSAAQTEGSAKEGGRGPSIWDHYVEQNQETGRVLNSSRFSTSIDAYKRYKEDIKIIKDLGVNSYRFSISWSRILPNGSLRGGINQEGIDHYNNVIDELVRNGIEPFVTLLHFDLPQALEDKYKGYLNRTFVNDFADYAELCFKTFGDRVKHWFTINEPTVSAVYGYEVGIAPPGRCSLKKEFCVFGAPPPGPCQVRTGKCTPDANSSTEPYIAAHNLILAHASAVKLYREKYQELQKGEIGVVLVSPYLVPYSESAEDIAATERSYDFNLGWFLEPFVFGEYPKSMKELVKERLPCFSAEEKSLIKGSLDFVAINYYKSYYVKNKQPSPTEEPRYTVEVAAEQTSLNNNGVPLGSQDNGNWPEGLEKLMVYIKEKYQNPTIYISENGLPLPRKDNIPLCERLKDSDRISYIARHLYRLSNAIKSGVNIKGYFCWSLFDDFEWGMGLFDAFGLHYIDFDDNLKRIPKQSAEWFHAFLQKMIAKP